MIFIGMRKGKIFECNKFHLQQLVKDSNTYSDVLKKLGLLPVGSNRYNLKEKIKAENIDDSHMASNCGFGWSSGKSLIEKDDALEYFVEKSSIDRASIKKYVLRYDLLPYVCQKCHQVPTWNNEVLVLDLDHINGKRNDNRLENLRFLCPNCHSQEKTSNRRLYQKTITTDMVKSVIGECRSKRKILQQLNVAESGSSYRRLNKILLDLS
jgi:Zn finger protein HypA/HybF involved in hydrogenase expression